MCPLTMGSGVPQCPALVGNEERVQIEEELIEEEWGLGQGGGVRDGEEKYQGPSHPSFPPHPESSHQES